ncbi:hypothetical protein CAEBREN_25230 [Caenorhabditis brenneri]|uniref:protein kinase C n=1 Tax=Caenorhabditis brenneri TaxID=135651 RepID=G0P3F2_CAEBE|nr:hypothetical protein CAEBREN_25230 [Caenorhabditis brenneri]
MDANDYPRLFYTSMPSSSNGVKGGSSTSKSIRLSSTSSTSTQRISTSSSFLIHEEERFRRHSTSTSIFPNSSPSSIQDLTPKNSEILENLTLKNSEENPVTSRADSLVNFFAVSDCDFSLAYYTAHEASPMISRRNNDSTLTPDDHNRIIVSKNSSNSSSTERRSEEGVVDDKEEEAFIEDPTELLAKQQKEYAKEHHFQLPTLLVTSTPSTVFDQNDPDQPSSITDDDIWTPYHPPSRQYSSSSEPMMSGLTFQLQSGIHKKSIAVEGNEIALRDLRNEAFSFVKEIYPEKKCGSLEDYILLYKHDLRSINILQLITTSSDVTDGTLVEIVIGSCPQNERIVVHPHTLFVHSYKVPTFCDFCGELLFGLVKQGLKCFGCGLNYHKRCASKIPNNCNGSKQRRPSAIPLSPSNSNILNLNERRQSRRDSCLDALDAARPSSTAGGAATPNIFITSDDCGDAIGGNFLQMPRKDRSCSWSGRPLWMEIAEATRVKIQVPHTFQVHSYKLPTVCQHCKKLLKGLLRQGMQCRDCKYNCHKKCSEHVAKDCSGNTKASQFFLGTADDGVSDDRDDDSSLRSGSGGHKKAQNTPSAPLQGSEGSGSPGPVVSFAAGLSNVADDDVISSESANIPLMRVVMSKKQTKRKNNKLLKEGWIVHYTDQQNMRKKHYWRLDTKGITMYQDENSTRYYKEIPLNEILGVSTSPPEKTNDYLFEIRTGACVYFVCEFFCWVFTGVFFWGKFG